MPKLPNQLFMGRYHVSCVCDTRLPERALAYRRAHNLLAVSDLASYNVTVWLVQDGQAERWIMERNTRIVDLRKPNEPVPMVEVGFHSEMLAYESLKRLPGFSSGQCRVRQIFTEREPCNASCKSMLETYVKGVPVFFYIREGAHWRNRWNTPTAQFLRVAYQL